MNTKTSRRPKALFAVLTLLAGLVAAAGLMASPASASAYGCSYWGAGSVGGISVAKGGYCAELNGSGTYVKYVGGGFNSVGNVCNWNITAEFFDTSGRWYQTYTGAFHSGCGRQLQDAI